MERRDKGAKQRGVSSKGRGEEERGSQEEVEECLHNNYIRLRFDGFRGRRKTESHMTSKMKALEKAHNPNRKGDIRKDRKKLNGRGSVWTERGRAQEKGRN